MQILVTIGSGVSEEAGVEFPTFPLTCVVVLKTLWHLKHSGTTVPACDLLRFKRNRTQPKTANICDHTLAGTVEARNVKFGTHMRHQGY